MWFSYIYSTVLKLLEQELVFFHYLQPFTQLTADLRYTDFLYIFTETIDNISTPPGRIIRTPSWHDKIHAILFIIEYSLRTYQIANISMYMNICVYRFTIFIIIVHIIFYVIPTLFHISIQLLLKHYVTFPYICCCRYIQTNTCLNYSMCGIYPKNICFLLWVKRRIPTN